MDISREGTFELIRNANAYYGFEFIYYIKCKSVRNVDYLK